MKLLDGKKVAAGIRLQVKQEVAELVKATGVTPELHIILASDDPASKIYVKRKLKACDEVGIRGVLKVYDPASSSHGCKNVSQFIAKLMSEMSIVPNPGLPKGSLAHGVIIQLPIKDLPDPKSLFDLIPPLKDVDVFHPENVGKLMQGRPLYKTCTPYGIMRLLSNYGIDVCGKTVCIINDSDIVGRPLSMMMTDAGASVTICHKRTDPIDLKYAAYDADIVVVAVGIPGFLTSDMVHTGSIVVDVGINRLPDGTIVGDVHPGVFEIAGWISPVPNGVGPMTICSLLSNTVLAAKLQIQGYSIKENKLEF